MDRKEFIKGSCGVCIALSSGFMLSAMLSSCKTQLGVIKASSKNDLVDIPLSEFDKSDFKIVRVNNYNFDLAVQKNADGTFSTLLLMCTHQSNPLTKTGNNYYCMAHGSQFDHQGKVTKGPAEKNLVRLKSVVEKDMLTIQLIAV
jgi:Rieske Fe-S protein